MDGDESIAIVGIGCRFPGANNQEEFWRVLKNGEDRVILIPKDRWNTEAFYDPDPDKCGKTYTRYAGIIENVEAWDNNFFGISDKEAEVMDPQQSMVLECTHMALEDAGITKREISGSSTAVFVGVMNNDYHIEVMYGTKEKNIISNYTLTGTPQSVIAARVSYVYNLLGPSMTLDTACSSSLVAIHQGAAAIRAGDCTAAICGGVAYILAPEITMGMSRSRIASRSGKCHTFSADADGYVRGEGCGIVVLKKLGDAQRDGNKIWATIVTGCNQDGHTATPITAPSGEQQSTLLQQVYNRYSIDPSVVQYIEAHGTGTPRGDPTEVDSLGKHFNVTEKQQDIYIGSVKTNVGHLEAASGVAGLIKVLLMMKHSTIVSNLHYHPPNPKLRFADYKFIVPEACQDWQPDTAGRRTACANCFGFGGTNAHAIIQQSLIKKQKRGLNNIARLLIISAYSKSALRLCLNDFLENLKTSVYNLDDVSFTSIRKRDHHAYRLSFVAKSINDVDTKTLMPRVNNAEHSETKSNHVVFVFCGVGTCWTGMCKALVTRFSVFREKIIQIDLCLQQYCSVSILELFENESEFTDPFLSHLSIFASQVCLAALWEHWGIVPNCVVGQSVGEVAAAVVCGALTLEDGVAVIYYRSKYLAEMCEGRMIVCLGVSTSVVEEVCNNIDDVSIAVYISPKASTVSGSETGIQQFKKTISEESQSNGLKLHHIPVSCAYHSKHVFTAGEHFLNSVKSLQANNPQIPIYSTVTGSMLCTDITPQYWFENITEPVKFQQAIEKSIQENKMNIFIEIGPSPILAVHLKDIIPSSSTTVLPSMTRLGDDRQLLGSLGAMYELGYQLKWDNLPCSGEVTDIPRTVFERQNVLKLPAISKKKRSTAELFKLSHLFVTETDADNVYEIQISNDTLPFAFEHYVLDHLVLPGATYIEAVMVIGKLLYTSCYSCKIKFEKFLFLEKEDTLSVALGTPETGEGYTFQIRKEDTFYAHGQILPADTPDVVSYDIEQIRSSCTQRLEKDEIYSKLKEVGFTYGPALQLLQYGLLGENVSCSEILLNDEVLCKLGSTLVHPCILDACLQATILSQQEILDWNGGIPFSVGSIQQHLTITHKMYIISYLRDVSESRIKHDIVLLNHKGGLVVEIKDYVTKLTGNPKLPTRFKYGIEWNKLTHVQSYERNPESGNLGHINKVILTCRDNIAQLHRLLGTESAVVLKMQSLIDTDGKTFFMQKFSKPVIDRWSNLDNVDVIIYQPGIVLEAPFSASKDVYEQVLYQCYSLVLLVRTLNTNKLKIPVVVMTENAVTVSGNDMCNPIAASLWGLARCIMLEVGASNLALLIDVSSNDDYKESCKLDFPYLFRSGLIECAVRDKSLYVNTITAIDDSDQLPTYKEIARDTACQAVLKSTQTYCLEDPHLVYTGSTPSGRLADGFVRLFVKSACLHNPLLYPTAETTTTKAKSQHRLGYSDGHCVLTFEVMGKVLPNMNEDVAVCYPLVAGSYADVPKECIIRIGAHPWYRPGMLTKMTLVLGLVRHVIQQSHVSVLVDEHDIYTADFIHTVLKRQHVYSSNVVSLSDLTKKRQYLYSTLLCLVPLTKSLSMLLKVHWKTPERFISLNSLIDGSNILSLSKEHQAFDTVLKSTDDILNLPTCKQFVPIISKIMKRCFKRNRRNTALKMKMSTSPINKTALSILSPARVLQLGKVKSRVDDLILNTVRVKGDHLFRKDSCYIVVGGMSGLGWEVMHILARMGAGYIVGTSRREATSSQRQMLNQTAKNNKCFMTALSADVNNLDSINDLLNTISNTFHSVPIKGIFHGAAVEADEHVFTISRETFDKGLRPKVQGTWNLHIATRSLSLDYFLTHSSVTALLGNLTQCNYGAGCTFQNAVMGYRRKLGFCGQSINWGALATGLAVGDKTKIEVLKHHGISFLEMDVTERCLVDALMHDYEDIAYCDVDWKVLYEEQKEYANVPIQRFRKLVSLKDNAIKQAYLYEEYDPELVASFVNELTDILAKTVPVDREILTPQTHLIDLGMDSMTSLAVVNKINSDLGVLVPLVLILSPNVTLNSLACYIINEQVGGRKPDDSEPGSVEKADSTNF